ncbi:dTDP-glucose 4,6-dehydratase [Roseiconus nitratireducens]|uniref:dTDP-glucose 4,6-dehydratase n=1 Tax=Roseiconus nitratireducens TaxID=2605748 RepID=A0A5M6DIQ7_9BACT|nr:dTDP-glucose 4,6-dehydratase [Roseiconus nitratireducens]KAA5546120.1 dTDP-glucose 4,6-dehydratase [Roseiconus nitratireducens]
MTTWLVTGGAGFIGGAFLRMFAGQPGLRLVVLDSLTYAGNLESIESVLLDPEVRFVRGDIGDSELLGKLLAEEQIDAVINFAAESHVDRSIDSPEAFVVTNVLGTFKLLDATLAYWESLSEPQREAFRFLHVSTDEVFGSLGKEGKFTERTPYSPNSPYSASKASSDHFVGAYHHTYGLPTLITNCSNNYGPYQFPEKLIPVMIMNALEGKHLPVYGDGQQVRDWLFVDDHCDAIALVLREGVPGATYNIGGDCERANIDIVHAICDCLDELQADCPSRPLKDLVRSVTDRPGHDRRYAIDFSKIHQELGWSPQRSFEEGLQQTVRWYLQHRDWVQRVRSGEYRRQGVRFADATT